MSMIFRLASEEFNTICTVHCNTLLDYEMFQDKQSFIDIRLRPGIATPLIAVVPITAKRDVIHKTGST